MCQTEHRAKKGHLAFSLSSEMRYKLNLSLQDKRKSKDIREAGRGEVGHWVKLYDHHWGPESGEILRFVCLQKDAKHCYDATKCNRTRCAVG